MIIMPILLLRIYGILLGLVHTACGAVILYLQIAHDDYTSRFQLVYDQALWFDCDSTIPDYGNNQFNESIGGRIQLYCQHSPGSKSMFYPNTVYFDVDLAYLLAAVFIWTGLWHFAYVSPCMWRAHIADRLWTDDENPAIRWIEYGPSAGLMMFIIAYFIGVTNVFTLVLIAVMMCLAISSTALAYGNKCKRVVVLPILINATVMITFWTRFGMLFEKADFDQMPGFVTAIIVGEFVMFQSFPVIYAMEAKNVKTAVFREFMYYTLSATSKLFLGAILTFSVFL